MATFGYMTGDNNDTNAEWVIAGTFAAPTSDGLATSISVKLISNNTMAGTNTSAALYTYIDNDSDYAGTLVAQTEVKSLVTDSAGTWWETYTFAIPPSITKDTNYYIMFGSDVVDDAYLQMRAKGSDAGYSSYAPGLYDDTFPVSLGDTGSSYHRLIYCTYTEVLSSLFYMSQSITQEKMFLYPDGAGCNTDLSKYPNTGSNYEKIDDPRKVPDADATYVYSSVSSLGYDLYTIDDSIVTSGTINYVKVFSRVKSHQWPQHKDSTYKIIITDDACSNIYKSSDINLTTGYTAYSNLWTENPRTSATWTWSEVNALQIGIECQTLEIDTGGTIVMKPVSTNSSTNFEKYGADEYHDCINDNDTNTYIYNDDVTNATMETELEDITEATAYSITDVKVEGKIQYSGGAYANVNILLGLELSGSTANAYSMIANSSPWINTSDSCARPGGGSWAWADFDSLNITERVDNTSGHSNSTGCIANMRAVIHYNFTGIPEIRTTQVYAMVSYDFTVDCTLTKPNEVSTDHSRNIKMLNFWNGEREVYDLERIGKGMVLKGIEWDDACTSIQCVRDMGLNGSNIVISNLTPDCFNGTYKIVSFGWKQVSKAPEVFEWILQLEDCEL